MDKIWLSSPHMGETELGYVIDAFKSNWIAPLGPYVDNFEYEISRYIKVGHCAALSSGTAAIHLALIALGIGRGDEVLCSTFTFSASANPILYQSAVPVFIESEDKTWNMNPFWLKKAIEDRIHKGQKPKALILVHLYGMPAQIDEILNICEFYRIPVIEDAAEALGSKYKDRFLGSFGTIGIFSFNGNKIITTSGGGALVSSDNEIVNKIRFLATQARDEAPHYQHSQVGYNYRMSNILAALGLGQIQVLDDRVRQRRSNHYYYYQALKDIDGISFLSEPSEDYFSNHWLTCILVDPRYTAGITHEDIRLALLNENIESRPLWKPMHLQPVFTTYPYYGDGISERLFKNGLCLPSGSNLSKNVLKKITSIVRKTVKKD